MFGMRDPPVFIPSPVDRYRQILLPALRLCQVILTSSMAQHLQAAGQVRGILSEEITWCKVLILHMQKP